MRWFPIAALILICATPVLAAKEPVLIEAKFVNDIPTDIDLKLYSQNVWLRLTI